jgi:hypothetical protein
VLVLLDLRRTAGFVDTPSWAPSCCSCTMLGQELGHVSGRALPWLR